ncbi:hypothetical protein AVEN_113448-1, partial [Araneus ventricosus]
MPLAGLKGLRSMMAIRAPSSVPMLTLRLSFTSPWMLRQRGGNSISGYPFLESPSGTTSTWMRSCRINKQVLASPGGTAMVVWSCWRHFRCRDVFGAWIGRLPIGILPIAMVFMTRLPENFCRSSPIMTPRTQNHPSFK